MAKTRTPPDNNPPSQDLIARICAGDAEAFDALYHRYRRLVHWTALGILHNQQDAEDLTQEVFLEISRKAHMYDPARGEVGAWIRLYAYHRSLRRKTNAKLRRRHLIETIDELNLPDPMPSSHAQRVERRDMLKQCMSQLQGPQRQVLTLVWRRDMSLTEIAEELGISFGQARHYYYRGLAKMKAWAEKTHGVGA